MWTADCTVDFVPLPPEKEKAYWASLESIAGLITRYMLEELSESVPPQIEGRDLEKDDG